MTDEEFSIKRKEWIKTAESMLADMRKTTNKEGLRVYASNVVNNFIAYVYHACDSLDDCRKGDQLTFNEGLICDDYHMCEDFGSGYSEEVKARFSPDDKRGIYGSLPDSEQ